MARRLPALGTRVATLPRAVAPLPSQPMTERADGRRVLLVDDEEGVRLILHALLDRDYRVSSVGSGEAAVAELPRFRPDLVLLDVKLLPSMSGLDALDHIKAFEPRIAVVMITAFASLATLNEALRRGAFGYLIKPFPRRDLDLMVRDGLGHRGGR